MQSLQRQSMLCVRIGWGCLIVVAIGTLVLWQLAPDARWTIWFANGSTVVINTRVRFHSPTPFNINDLQCCAGKVQEDSDFSNPISSADFPSQNVPGNPRLSAK